MAEPEDAPAIRHAYAAEGVREFYETRGNEYRNPHEQAIAAVLEKCVTAWPLDLARVLDLACGSGEVTLALRAFSTAEIVGVDPFTGVAYKKRTGQDAGNYSFADIANGSLATERFSLIICSYALHLEEPSRLPMLLLRLSELAPHMLIISPHKRPEIRPEWGWEIQQEMYYQRVRARWFTNSRQS